MKKIFAERENANDDVVIIAEIHKKNGDEINQNELIFTLEGEKTAYDVLANNSGFFYTKYEDGDEVKVDSIIGILSASKLNEDEEIEHYFEDTDNIQETSNLDDNLIKKNLINNAQDHTKIISEQRIAVIGGGAGLSQVLEITKLLENVSVECVYDDILFGEVGHSYNVPVIGTIDIEKINDDYKNKNFDALIISISSNMDFRSSFYQEAKEKGIPFTTLIHPKTTIDDNSVICEGCILLPNVHVGPFAYIGANNFISAFCNIEHHCVLGQTNTFGPGVLFSGHVSTGDNVKFGTGIFVEPKVKICSDIFVPSGSTVVKNINSKEDIS